MADFSAVKALLFKRSKEKQLAAATEREQFIADVLDGKTTDAEQILAGCEKYKLSPEQLEAAVGALSTRRANQKIVADESKVRQQIAELEAKRDAINAELAVAQQKAHTEGTANYEAYQAANRHLARIERAKVELRDSAPTELKSKRETLEQRVNAMTRQAYLLRQNLKSDSTAVGFNDENGNWKDPIIRRRKMYERDLETARQNKWADKAAIAEEGIRVCDAERKQCEVDLAQIERELPKLQEQLDQHNAKELVS